MIVRGLGGGPPSLSQVELANASSRIEKLKLLSKDEIIYQGKVQAQKHKF